MAVDVVAPVRVAVKEPSGLSVSVAVPTVIAVGVVGHFGGMAPVGPMAHNDRPCGSLSLARTPGGAICTEFATLLAL